MNQIEIKKEMNKRDESDSFTIGTPATCGSLKVYFNSLDIELAKEKISNLFKLKDFVECLKESK